MAAQSTINMGGRTCPGVRPLKSNPNIPDPVGLYELIFMFLSYTNHKLVFTIFPSPTRNQMNVFHTLRTLYITAVLTLLLPCVTYATTTASLQGFNTIESGAANVLGFLRGPIATTIILIAIVVCGLMWLGDRQGQHAKKLGTIGMAAVLIFLAPQVLGILGIGGAGI